MVKISEIVTFNVFTQQLLITVHRVIDINSRKYDRERSEVNFFYYFVVLLFCLPL